MGKLVCIGGGEIPRNKNGIILPYETEEIDFTILDYRRMSLMMNELINKFFTVLKRKGH